MEVESLEEIENVPFLGYLDDSTEEITEISCNWFSIRIRRLRCSEGVVVICKQ